MKKAMRDGIPTQGTNRRNKREKKKKGVGKQSCCRAEVDGKEKRTRHEKEKVETQVVCVHVEANFTLAADE